MPVSSLSFSQALLDALGDGGGAKQAGTLPFCSCLRSHKEALVVVVAAKVGRCFFVEVEMETVEAWDPRPFCIRHGSKAGCPAGYWHEGACAAAGGGELEVRDVAINQV